MSFIKTKNNRDPNIYLYGTPAVIFCMRIQSHLLQLVCQMNNVLTIEVNYLLYQIYLTYKGDPHAVLDQRTC